METIARRVEETCTNACEKNYESIVIREINYMHMQFTHTILHWFWYGMRPLAAASVHIHPFRMMAGLKATVQTQTQNLEVYLLQTQVW